MTSTDPTDGDPLMTTAEVAAVFRVDPQTVTRWAKKDRLPHIKTPGQRGVYRFRESDVRTALKGGEHGEDQDH